MLDASVRAQILAVLLELQAPRELALLFITHDLSLAWSLCDRIAVMYLGPDRRAGLAADVIERPQHPYTQALVDAVPVATPGGGGRARAARRRASRRDRGAQRLPLPPALPAALRALRQGRSAAAPGGRAGPARGLPAARSRRARRRQPVAERWRDIAGPVGRLEPGARNAITDVPGVRVGHAQAASGERTGRHGGRAAGAAGARRRPRSSTASASSPASSRSTSAAGWRRPSTSAARTRSAPSTRRRSLASGRGPEDVVLPVVGECDDGDADSRTVDAGDVERALARARRPRSPRAASAPAPG